MCDDEDNTDDDYDSLKVDLAVLQLVLIHCSNSAPFVLY